jgi:hypothetical protein
MSGTAPYYAEVFAPMPGRCLRMLPRGDQGPDSLPGAAAGWGSFQAKNSRRYAVQACDGHRAPLKNVRPISC